MQSPNSNSRTAERETKCLTNNRCQAGSLFFRFGVMHGHGMPGRAPRRCGSGLCRAATLRAGACDGGCVHSARGRCSRPCPAAAPPTTTASTTRPRLSCRRRPRGVNVNPSARSPCHACHGQMVPSSFIMELGTPTGTGHRHHVVCGSRAADRSFGPQKYWHIHCFLSFIFGPSINLLPAITLNPML